MKRYVIKILIYLCFLLSFYLFSISGYELLGKVLLKHTGKETTGQVISSYDEFSHSTQTGNKRSGRSIYVKRPIIEYQVGGEKFQIHGEILGEIGKDYQLNQKLEILYSSENPDYAMIYTFSEFWYPPARSLLLASALLYLGIRLRKIGS